MRKIIIPSKTFFIKKGVQQNAAQNLKFKNFFLESFSILKNIPSKHSVARSFEEKKK